MFFLKKILISFVIFFSSSFVLASMQLAKKSYEKKNYKKAFELYSQFAQEGDMDAQWMLMKMYYNGSGVARNYRQAYKWNRKAADQGNVNAQIMLGVMYELGLGTQKNYFQAFKWYKKTANIGVARSLFKLGCMYYFGVGTQKNYKDAHMYLYLALSGNYKIASVTTLINELEKKMSLTEIVQARKMAVEWLKNNPNEIRSSSEKKLRYEISFSGSDSFDIPASDFSWSTFHKSSKEAEFVDEKMQYELGAEL